MNDAGTTEGDVWSFTTGGAPVVVNPHRQGATHLSSNSIVCGRCSATITIVDND